MNGTNVSESVAGSVWLVQSKLFLLWEKQFHVQLTLVSHENISEAGLSFVIQNHPLYFGFLEAQ